MSSVVPRTSEAASHQICLSCGMCCNGIIFADVRLQPGDDPKQLGRLGLTCPTRRSKASARQGTDTPSQIPIRQWKFPQPCAAFDGCRCSIYAERPGYCRQFECGVLKSVRQGKLDGAAALQIVHTAKAHAQRAVRLLRKLGDTDEGLRPAARFQRTTARLEAVGLDRKNAHAYSQLTLAIHDLNFILSEAFYPGHNAQELLELLHRR